MDDAENKTERTERIRNGKFEQEGYNANIDQPVDIEPVPKDAPGAAIDIRDMPDGGVVEVNDDDTDILDEEKRAPASR